jgi:hypothetical protein
VRQLSAAVYTQHLARTCNAKGNGWNFAPRSFWISATAAAAVNAVAIIIRTNFSIPDRQRTRTNRRVRSVRTIVGTRVGYLTRTCVAKDPPPLLLLLLHLYTVAVGEIQRVRKV